MKTLIAFLSLVGVAVLLPVSHAAPGGNVLEVEGSVMAVLPGQTTPQDIAAGLAIPEGSILYSAKGAGARISIPGVGVIDLAGATAIRIDLVEGIPAVTVLRGEAGFAFESGRVLLVVAGGKLNLSGVAGHTSTFERGTAAVIEHGRNGTTVDLRAGSAIFAADGEFVRMATHETRRFAPSARAGGARTVLLKSREIEIELPPEVLKAFEGELPPALQEIEQAWSRNRESPRIP